MNTNATIEKMQKMRLNGMKRAYESSFETRNQDTCSLPGSSNLKTTGVITAEQSDYSKMPSSITKHH